MAAVYTIQESGYALAPAVLVMATATISFVVMLRLSEPRRAFLRGAAETSQVELAAADQSR